MKLSVYNLAHDMQPQLHVEAENAEERKQLERLEDEMHPVQLAGIRHGKAGRYNACGSMGDDDGIDSLSIDVRLGGEPDHKDCALCDAIKKLVEESQFGGVGNLVKRR